MGHRWAACSGTCTPLIIPPQATGLICVCGSPAAVRCLQIHWGVPQQKWRSSQQEDEEFRVSPEQRSAGPQEDNLAEQLHNQWGAFREPLDRRFSFYIICKRELYLFHISLVQAVVINSNNNNKKDSNMWEAIFVKTLEMIDLLKYK